MMEAEALQQAAMFRFRPHRRLFTAIPLLVALAVGGLSDAFQPLGSCLSVFGSQAAHACTSVRKCCCGVTPVVCGCQEQDEPAAPAAPNRRSDDSGWVKWSVASPLPLSDDGIVARKSAVLSSTRLAGESPGRSLQSLLCVWRI